MWAEEDVFHIAEEQLEEHVTLPHLHVEVLQVPSTESKLKRFQIGHGGPETRRESSPTAP